MALKIYDVEGFPNPARIRIALAEKGMLDQVEFVPVNVLAGEHRQDAFTAKNPSASVPLLETEDGEFISECTAITEYLDAAFDDGVSLTGKTPIERARIHMMQRRAEQKVLDAVGYYFHHATPGLGPDLEVDQVATWGEKQKQRALDGMIYFNRVLSDTQFVAGDVFSMADITLFAGLSFADFAKIEIPESLTALHAWRAKMVERPGFQH